MKIKHTHPAYASDSERTERLRELRSALERELHRAGQPDRPPEG